MTLASVVVEVKTVNKVMPKQWNVEAVLKGYDGANGTGSILFEQDFYEDYQQGDTANVVEAGFVKQMQAFIDKWKKERQILTSQAMATSMEDIKTALEV